MQRLIWLLLFVLAIMLGVLVAQQDGAFLGLSGSDLAWLLVRTAFLVVIAAIALRAFRGRLSYALRSAGIWLCIALLLAVGYTYRFELEDVGDRVLAELVPGHVSSHGRSVEVVGRGGNFSITAQVNGVRVPMVYDTGASAVVLTQEAARAVGLPLQMLSYSVNIDTANGRARAAPVMLDHVAVGGIVEDSVAALIAQPGQLRTSLLGLSFLNRLESYEVRGDQLMLRGYP